MTAPLNAPCDQIKSASPPSIELKKLQQSLVASSNDREADKNEENIKNETEQDEEVDIRQFFGKILIEHPDQEELSFHNERIFTMEFDPEMVKKCKLLCLKKNCIKVLEGLEHMELEHLDLSDNNIRKIENLETQKKLRYFNISYNRIKKIQNLEPLENCEEVYLQENKFQLIENLSHFRNIRILELGSNNLRKIENISTLTTLTQLYLGRNKITEIGGLDTLVNLKILSLQANRLRKIENLSKLASLEELYLSENGITGIENIESLKNLKILDVADNRLAKIDNCQDLPQIEEIWADNNRIEDPKESLNHLKLLPNLKCVTLRLNPFNRNMNDVNYHALLNNYLPNVKDTDSYL